MHTHTYRSYLISSSDSALPERLDLTLNFAFAPQVSDAAHGAQVLITHEAWVRLRKNMAAAGFPVIHMLGLYQLQAVAEVGAGSGRSRRKQ